MRRGAGGGGLGVAARWGFFLAVAYGAGFWSGWGSGAMSGVDRGRRERQLALDLAQSRQDLAAAELLRTKAQKPQEQQQHEADGQEKDAAESSSGGGGSGGSFDVVDSLGQRQTVDQHGIDVEGGGDAQRRALAGEQLPWREIEQLPMYRHVFARGDARLPGGRRVLLCPRWAEDKDKLQIPLKHLPRKKATSVDEKYDRRASNCQKGGIWHKISLEDHMEILKVIEKQLAVSRGDHVFDWGSGCGHKLRFLADKRGVSGFGLDVSEKSTEYALVNTTRENHFCRANGVRTDEWMPENYYDAALSFGSVYHVYNRTTFCSVLRSMLRVVKKGGRMYNGWTENAEYRRDDAKMCFRDLPVKVEVVEEDQIFRNVKVFPLKAQRYKPNTYSLVVTKLEATVVCVACVPSPRRDRVSIDRHSTHTHSRIFGRTFRYPAINSNVSQLPSLPGHLIDLLSLRNETLVIFYAHTPREEAVDSGFLREKTMFS